jgi:putative ABC transport system permease protein
MGYSIKHKTLCAMQEKEKIMFKNYLTIALRNIKKYKGYSLINIIGLAVGMACSILILLWVLATLSFDKFHDNVYDIYVLRQTQYHTNGAQRTSPSLPGPLAPALESNFPEIINSARFFNPGELLLNAGEKKFFESGVAGVDPSFFEIFTFPFVAGDSNTALDKISSIVLTEKMAQKYFGDEIPIGKTISFNNKYDFLVTGVVKNVPSNSHIKFDFLVPFEFIKNVHEDIEGWSFFRCYSYFQLEETSSYQELSGKIKTFLNDRIQIESRPELSLTPLSKYFVFEENDGVLFKLVILFSFIAILIWTIACINFINLSTARAINRAKEVGTRKVVGANRIQLIGQFLGESIILSLISFILALLFVELALPGFSNLAQVDIRLPLTDHLLLLGLLLITVTTGIVSGIYPALYLSSFHPIKVLKESLSTGQKKAKFQKTLVVTQFAVAIILMIATAFVFKQLDLVRTKDMGFDKENVIYIPMKGDIQDKDEYTKQELLAHPEIVNVTMAHNKPDLIGGSGWYWSWQGKDPDHSVNVFETSVDYDFIETLDLAMTQGRFFARQFPSDLKNAVIINETAVKIMGFDSPIGEKIKRFSEEYTVIGVIKDFNFLPITEEIGPLTLRLRCYENRHMFVKIRPNNFSKTIGFIKDVFARYNPHYPFEYSFWDEEIDILAKYMLPLGEIIFLFSLLAVFVSCLGLFGLISFMAQNRTREVCIRKVFGASVSKIVYSLSRDFTKCVLFANLFALPLAYFIVSAFLQVFAYRVNIDAWTFIGLGLFTVLIAFGTVSYQAIRAARTNPVEALRYE